MDGKFEEMTTNECLSFFSFIEQIFQNIKQEYSRYQRWRHLEVVLSQSEACTSESQPPSSALTAPSSPGKHIWC